jgi:hypothetical protein
LVLFIFFCRSLYYERALFVRCTNGLRAAHSLCLEKKMEQENKELHAADQYYTSTSSMEIVRRHNTKLFSQTQRSHSYSYSN